MSCRVAGSRPFLLLTAAFVAAAGTSCGGKSTPTQTETPVISVSINPTAGTVERGGSTDVGVTVTGSGGFTGVPTITLQSPPSGVTGTVSNSQTAGATTTATLTIGVGASVAPGAYTLTVRATGSGVTAVQASFALTVTAASAYTLSATPSSVSIEQGSDGTADIELTRTVFSGAVTLAVEGAPSGVTPSFSINPVSGTASVLTLAVDATVATGTYALTIRGTATGLTDRTTDIDLVVTAPATPGFSLESISSLSIPQGSAAVRTVTITRSGGFTGDVTVTVTDLPVGITSSVDPVTTSGTSVDVTITVAGTVAVGSYTATVRANASGFAEATASLDINVTVPTGAQVVLDFSVCTTDQRPMWLAYQDGAGPWTSVTGVGDTYTFNIASATAAVAVAVEPSASEVGVFVVYATQTEMVSGDLSELCDFEVSGKAVTGTVAGLDVSLGEGASISLGDAATEVNGNGGFSLAGVPDGNLDLVGYKWSTTGATDRMILMRDLDPAAGSDLGTLDFAGASGFDPISATITVTGGGGTGMGSWEVEYGTSPSSGACYYQPLDAFFYQSGQFTARGVPAARQEAGDVHVVTVSDGYNTVYEMFTQLQNRTIAYAQALPTPSITDITGAAAFRRVRAELTLPAEYNSLLSVALVNGAGDRSLVVLATADWLGGLSATVEVPDLTGAAGWNDTWAPTSASTTDWALTGSGWTGDDCADGSRGVSGTVVGIVG